MFEANEVFPLDCYLKIWLSADKQLERFRLAQFRQADDLPPAWDLITQENPLASREHLAALENASEGLTCYYFILFEENTSVACFYFQLITLSRRNYDKFSEKKWLDGLFGHYINHRKYGLLTCGSLFHNYFQGVFVTKNAPPNLVLRALCRAIDKIRRTKKVSAILIKDASSQIQELLSVDSEGFTKLPQDISMEMEIPESWQTFLDYRSSLTSKYAARVRKTQQSLGSVTRREITSSELPDYQQKIHELYLQLVQKQSIRIGIVQQDYWYSLKQHLAENFIIYGYFIDNKLIAFSTTYNLPSHFEVHYIGFDTILNQQYSLYFNILLDAVSDAIQKRAKKLILGRTALEAKAIVGCKPKTLCNLLRTHSNLLAWSIELFYEWFQQGQNDNWKNRNPFKNN